VVALSLVAVVILALVRVTISSIQNSSFARDQQTATQYAQEGIENARRLKEQNEIEFWGKSGSEEERLTNLKEQLLIPRSQEKKIKKWRFRLSLLGKTQKEPINLI